MSIGVYHCGKCPRLAPGEPGHYEILNHHDEPARNAAATTSTSTSTSTPDASSMSETKVTVPNPFARPHLADMLGQTRKATEEEATERTTMGVQVPNGGDSYHDGARAAFLFGRFAANDEKGKEKEDDQGLELQAHEEAVQETSIGAKWTRGSKKKKGEARTDAAAAKRQRTEPESSAALPIPGSIIPPRKYSSRRTVKAVITGCEEMFFTSPTKKLPSPSWMIHTSLDGTKSR